MEKLEIISKEKLYDYYVTQNKSLQDISEIIGMSKTWVRKKMESFEIPIRSGSRKGRKNKKQKIVNKDISIGDKSGLLTVIKKKQTTLLCECKCGNVIEIKGSRIRLKQVKSCGCLLSLGKHGFVSYALYNGIKRKAERRNKVFDLSIDDINDLFIKQNKKCAITNMPLIMKKDTNDSVGNASLDRIDSSKGYVRGNIQWIHKDVNKMKMDLPQDYFFELCLLIVKSQATSPEKFGGYVTTNSSSLS